MTNALTVFLHKLSNALNAKFKEMLELELTDVSPLVV